jgi:hypothetical protein
MGSFPTTATTIKKAKVIIISFCTGLNDETSEDGSRFNSRKLCISDIPQAVEIVRHRPDIGVINEPLL